MPDFSGAPLPVAGCPKCRIACGGEKFYRAPVKHSGKAAESALKLIGLSGAAVLALIVVAFVAKFIGALVVALAGTLVALWMLFALFTFYFFRDPDPSVPSGKNLVLAPGHGRVDTIDTTTEPEFLGGECRRISIFLSVFNVHVQNAPLTGRVAFFKHSPGQYLNAMRADCAKYNENVLIGIEAGEPMGVKIGVRLIAGLIARRIVCFTHDGARLAAGDRFGLIRFGSRVDVYLPAGAHVLVGLDSRCVAGETVIAQFGSAEPGRQFRKS